MRSVATVLMTLSLVAGCATTVGPAPQRVPQRQVSAPVDSGGGQIRNFGYVASRVEPVAEEVCRRQRTVRNCDFRIVLDNRPDSVPNAYQTLDDNGRPVLIVTASLLEELRNPDEVAFVLGHEAAHHIEGHLPKTQDTATAGAVLAGVLVAAGGGNAAAIESAQQLGAKVGSRAYSKNFELEADSLGTVIAYGAGFDPVLGAQYFARSADPGNQFLGSHPPNADRIKIVRQTAAQLY